MKMIVKIRTGIQIHQLALSLAVLVLPAAAFMVRAQSPAGMTEVRGKVLDSNRAAIVGARIIVRPSGSSLLTDGQGEFSLALPAGNYTLEFAADNFASASKSISVGANKS